MAWSIKCHKIIKNAHQNSLSLSSHNQTACFVDQQSKIESYQIYDYIGPKTQQLFTPEMLDSVKKICFRFIFCWFDLWTNYFSSNLKGSFWFIMTCVLLSYWLWYHCTYQSICWDLGSLGNNFVAAFLWLFALSGLFFCNVTTLPDLSN